jgi:hypothetical protein
MGVPSESGETAVANGKAEQKKGRLAYQAAFSPSW